jgi:hypothetical protein
MANGRLLFDGLLRLETGGGKNAAERALAEFLPLGREPSQLEKDLLDLALVPFRAFVFVLVARPTVADV